MTILEIIFHIIELLSSGIAGLLFVRARRITIFIGLGALIFMDAVLLDFLPDKNVAMMLSWLLIALLAIFFFFFEKKKIGDAWIAFCISASINEICIIFDKGLHLYQNENVSFWLINSLFSGMIGILFFLFRQISLPEQWETSFAVKKEEEDEEEFVLGPFHIYLMSGSLAFIMVVLFPLISDVTKPEFIAKITLAGVIVAGMIAFMLLLIDYSSKMALYSVEYNYHDEVNSFMNVVRSQRHDYNLHVQTVASLIQQEKWDDCREYVDALVLDTTIMNSILPVKDPAIAALINNFKNMAAQRKIIMTIDIRDDLSHVTTSVYETNKVIGNLLQNAMDEIEQMEGRKGEIELNIFKRGEFCLIRVSNQVRNKEQFQKHQEDIFNQGFTTKRGHDGVGLSSLRSLLTKVDGDIFSWLEGDTVHFVASIPVNYLQDER